LYYLFNSFAIPSRITISAAEPQVIFLISEAFSLLDFEELIVFNNNALLTETVQIFQVQAYFQAISSIFTVGVFSFAFGAAVFFADLGSCSTGSLSSGDSIDHITGSDFVHARNSLSMTCQNI
jgi:hypothetical protein